jgi:hypothetical protein
VIERADEILAFASLHRVVLSEQVQVLLHASQAEARVRLDALTSAGLMRRERISYALPDLFRITPAGLSSLGSDLPSPRGAPRWRYDVAAMQCDQRHAAALQDEVATPIRGWGTSGGIRGGSITTM